MSFLIMAYSDGSMTGREYAIFLIRCCRTGQRRVNNMKILGRRVKDGSKTGREHAIFLIRTGRTGQRRVANM